MKFFGIIFLCCLTLTVAGQHSITFPTHEGWNVVREGQTLQFSVLNHPYGTYFSMEGGMEGVTFDSLGNFRWTPDFNVVDRIEKVKEFSFAVQAHFPDQTRDRKTLTVHVHHVNRPPVIEELPVLYVKQNYRNTYQFPDEYVKDPDGDPISFRALAAQLPEGATLTSQGNFSWSPSRTQFANLKGNPLILEFIVQDQPDKSETTGKLRIAQTQLDLPPELLIVPGDSVVTLKEDATLNLKLYLSDPNGDEDVRNAGFISTDTRVAPSVLKSNTPVQYEFTWTPGYEFVQEVQKNLDVDLTFFALDKSNNRIQKRIRLKILDTENIAEKDAHLFEKYRNNLVAAMELLRVLDETQKELNEEYRKAKRGKKHRSILNATLGAATGLSPVTLEADQAKIVSGIGGTTVLTLGTLEATEVIGQSKESILEKIKIDIEVRNKIQSLGDEFARKYALKSSRRSPDFDKDIDKLRTATNDQRLVLLELDAKSGDPDKISNKAIKKVFLDFTEE